jgi:hypothetical protein
MRLVVEDDSKQATDAANRNLRAVEDHAKKNTAALGDAVDAQVRKVVTITRERAFMPRISCVLLLSRRLKINNGVAFSPMQAAAFRRSVLSRYGVQRRASLARSECNEHDHPLPSPGHWSPETPVGKGPPWRTGLGGSGGVVFCFKFGSCNALPDRLRHL